MKRKEKYNPLKFYSFLVFGVLMLLLGSTDNFSLLSHSQDSSSSFTYIHLSHPALIEPENVFSFDQPYQPNTSGFASAYQNLFTAYIQFPDNYKDQLKALAFRFLKIKPLLLERYIMLLIKIPKELVPQSPSLK